MDHSCFKSYCLFTWIGIPQEQERMEEKLHGLCAVATSADCSASFPLNVHCCPLNSLQDKQCRTLVNICLFTPVPLSSLFICLLTPVPLSSLSICLLSHHRLICTELCLKDLHLLEENSLLKIENGFTLQPSGLPAIHC